MKFTFPRSGTVRESTARGCFAKKDARRGRARDRARVDRSVSRLRSRRSHVYLLSHHVYHVYSDHDDANSRRYSGKIEPPRERARERLSGGITNEEIRDLFEACSVASVALLYHTHVQWLSGTVLAPMLRSSHFHRGIPHSFE